MRRVSAFRTLSIAATAHLLILGCDSPTEPRGITVALANRALTIAQGSGTTVGVTIGRTNFDGPVSLSLEGVPSAVSASLADAVLPSGATISALGIHTSGATAPGTFTLTVRATAEGVTPQTAAMEVTVTIAGSFTVNVLPATTTVAQGGAGTTTVIVSRKDGFVGDISFDVSSASSGLTATLASTTRNSAAIRIAASGNVTPQTHQLTVTATSPGMSPRTTTFPVAVITPPSTASVSLPFCAPLIPVWFAVQNEGYDWQTVSPSDGTYTFDATEKFGVAWAWDHGTAAEVVVVYRTRADDPVTLLSGLCAGGKTVTGSVAGLTSGQSALVAMGLSRAWTSTASSTFTLRNLDDGPLDLVAARASSSTTHGNFTPDRLVVLRSLNLVDGATVPPLDFSSSEAFAPATNTLLVTGLEVDDDVSVTNRLWSAGSTFAIIHRATQISGTTPFHSVPSPHLTSGDLHELWTTAWHSNWLNRNHLSTFEAATDRSVELGPYVNVPTVTQLTEAPYLRMRGQLAAQPEYGNAVRFIFGGLRGARRNVHVLLTAAYLGGTPTTWDAIVPDLSAAAGFQTSWMPMAGEAEYYQVESFTGFSWPHATVGEVVRFSTRVGRAPTAAPAHAGQARTQRESAPSMMHFFPR